MNQTNAAEYINFSAKTVESSGEAAVVAVMSSLLSSKKGSDLFCEVVEAGGVAKFILEFPVPKGRIDILVSHEDGSISVVEVKEGNCRGKIYSGIGQLSLYAVQLAGRHGVLIRRVLVWDFSGDVQSELDICKACENARVIPFPIGKISAHKQIAEDLFSKLNGADKCH